MNNIQSIVNTPMFDKALQHYRSLAAGAGAPPLAVDLVGITPIILLMIQQHADKNGGMKSSKLSTCLGYALANAVLSMTMTATNGHVAEAVSFASSIVTDMVSCLRLNFQMRKDGEGEALILDPHTGDPMDYVTPAAARGAQHMKQENDNG